MPLIDYRQLRRQITMGQVLELLGFQPTWRRGPQLRGGCPIPGCRAAGRPFSVHLGRQVYHCFACGSHGNPLDLWAATRRLTLYEAALDLCETAQLTPPRLPASQPIPAPPQPCRVANSAPHRNR